VNRSIPFPPYRDARERNDESIWWWGCVNKCHGAFCRQSPVSTRRVTLGKEIAEDCVDNRVFNLDEKNRLNKMLAHISYSRAEYISNGKHGWETAKMLALIIDQLEIFFATLAPMKRAWFPTSEYLSDSKTLASKLASDFEYNMCNSCLTDENHTGE
jgi:hypothetical protein